MDIGQLIKVDEAAKALGLSRFFLYRLMADGKLPHFRAGKAIRLNVEEVRKWMRENANGNQN